MMRFTAKKILCYFLLLSTASLLVNCTGWRLRGSDADTGKIPPESVFIKNSNSQSFRLINQQLKKKNILTSALNASRQLLIDNEQWQRRSISISRSETISEYELTLTIDYSILDGEQMLLRGPSELRLSRSFAYDENDISGKDKEENLIRDDLLRAAARQIIQQLELSYR